MFNLKLDISLIRLVKSHTVLYDYNDPKYMDFNAREVAWHKIGDELNQAAADCKVRWIHIRDVNRRILKKSISTGEKVRQYKYETELAFMRPFYKDVIVQNNEYELLDNDSNEDDNQQEEETIDYAIESDESDQKPIVRKKKKMKPNKKKNRKRIQNDEPQLSFENIIPSELDPADPIDSFLLSIRATMKTFTPYHQNVAKTKIFTMVQEQELKQIVQQQKRQK